MRTDRDVPSWIRAERADTLPDYVRPGLDVLICGLNPSLRSAETGVPYGRPGNRFWPAAVRAVTPRAKSRRIILEAVTENVEILEAVTENVEILEGSTRSKRREKRTSRSADQRAEEGLPLLAAPWLAAQR